MEQTANYIMLFIKSSECGHLYILWLLYGFVSSSIFIDHHGRMNSTLLYLRLGKTIGCRVLVPSCGQYVLEQSMKWSGELPQKFSAKLPF